ncbi:hypothetical protein SBV1_1170032 [Verrucomicrobia bacterium]|nr:hypothetical protein SBV1_1170032 [Verrucomicrobiota bacterium]
MRQDWSLTWSPRFWSSGSKGAILAERFWSRELIGTLRYCVRFHLPWRRVSGTMGAWPTPRWQPQWWFCFAPEQVSFFRSRRPLGFL